MPLTESINIILEIKFYHWEKLLRNLNQHSKSLSSNSYLINCILKENGRDSQI